MPMSKADAKRQQDFLAQSALLFRMAEAVVDRRSSQYNQTHPIQHNIPSARFAYDMAAMKMRRLEGLLQAWEESSQDDAVLIDSLIDTVAYISFVYGWLREPKVGEDAGPAPTTER